MHYKSLLNILVDFMKFITTRLQNGMNNKDIKAIWSGISFACFGIARDIPVILCLWFAVSA